MRILSRLLMIVVLLVGLAYGSYAVGKYALSKYLFGPQATSGSGSDMATVARSTKVAESVLRQTDWKGTKPRVELKVLPARDAGPGPDLPLTAMPQEQPDVDAGAYSPQDESSTVSKPAPNSVPSDAPRRYENSRNVDNAPLNYSLSRTDEEYRRSEEERPRRRRRRRRSTKSTSARVTAPAPSSDADSYPVPDAPVLEAERAAAPIISGGTGSASSSGGGSSSPTRSSASSGSAAASSRPTSSRPKRVRTRTRRRPARQRHQSPVPRPEGSSGGGRILDGGNSPVPRPE